MIKRGRTPVEEAARLLSACVKHTCAAERIPLEAAVGRVCMQDIFCGGLPAAVFTVAAGRIRGAQRGYCAGQLCKTGGPAGFAASVCGQRARSPGAGNRSARYDRRSRAGGRGLCGGAGTDGLRPKNGFHL